MPRLLEAHGFQDGQARAERGKWVLGLSGLSSLQGNAANDLRNACELSQRLRPEYLVSLLFSAWGPEPVQERRTSRP